MRLVIFDMDGTLVDTAGVMVESARAAFAALDLEAPDAKTIRSVSGLALNEGMQILAPDQSQQVIDRLEESYRTTYLDLVSSDTREALFEGTLDAIERLAQSEDTLMAVATGKALRGANRVLREHNIAHHFTSVQTPDHNPSKPNPAMIYSAMEAVGASAQNTIMVGDTTHDMNMARAGKVAALGVDWGYHTIDELRQTGAQKIISDFAEIDAAIDELLERDDA